MNLTKAPYKGTRDFFSKDKRIRDYIFHLWSKTAEEFGYESYDGPLLEEVDLYKAKSGEELINEQIYSFTDRGERFVAIRPEMTPTLARMVSQVIREFPKPLRWYSIPNLYRYEKPQKGRLREHWQFNVDIFGAEGVLGEIEILLCIKRLFENFGAHEGQYEILINSRKIVDIVFTKMMKLDAQVAYKLYKLVDRAKKISTDDLNKELDKFSLDITQKEVFQKYIKLTNFTEAIKLVEDNASEEVLLQLKYFQQNIISLKLDNICKYDPAIVRGLDYYTGIVFECFDTHPENRRALLGGGAYENLLKIFNEDPVAGVGFGMGDVTVLDFLTTHNLLPDFSRPSNDVFICFLNNDAQQYALEIAQLLRTKSFKVLCHLTTVKAGKAFQLAESKGATNIILLGEDEIKNNNFKIKNLKSRNEKLFSKSEIIEIEKFMKAVL